jgi:hypothetical protein
MPLWGNIDNASGNSKPKYANTATTFGVSKTEAANTLGDGPTVAHSGWVKQTVGTGPIVSITVEDAGDGYANGEFLTFTGGSGTGANGSVTVDSNGSIVAITVTNSGSGFTSAPVVDVDTANGANAVITAVVGGRAGRRHYETLVATSTITGDNTADNTFFPGT